MAQQLTMADLTQLGDEKAQRQHLGNQIFAYASQVNAEMAPRVVGMIVFHLPLEQILTIVNNPTSRQEAIEQALKELETQNQQPQQPPVE